MKKIIKYFTDISLAKKFIVIYLVIGIIPLSILGYSFYKQMSGFVEQRQKDNYNNYLSQFSATINNKVDVYDGLLNYVVFDQSISRTMTSKYESDYDFYKAVTTTVDPMLTTLKYLHDDISEIKIYSQNVLVDYDNRLFPLSKISNEKWYSEALSSSNTLWTYDKNSKKILAIRKMPLLNRNNIKAVIVLEVKENSLFSSFNQFSDDDNFSLFIKDSNNSIVYTRKHFQKQFIGLSLDYNNLNDKSLSKKGVTWYTVSSKDNHLEWQIEIFYPSLIFTSKIREITFVITLIAVIVIILGLVAILFASKFITGRIRNLNDNIKIVQEGNLDVSVNSESQDEIGSLIQGFSKMLNELKRLIEENYISKLHQKEYEMRALQQQINPHFLYNTLSMINFKALEIGGKDISKITLALSSFYRTSLNKGRNYCSIEDELNNMQSYISIQSIMHDYNFDVEIEIEDEIRKYETLNLILQPIVENAIVHGIDLLEGKRGKIKVYATSNEKDVFIMIEDNGIGMDKDTLNTMLSKNSKGYGIRNVNERIKLYYGNDYGLYVESVIGQGTLVTVRTPKIIYQIHD